MLACARGSGAQQPGPEPRRSTLDGVFSAAQAASGRDAYALRCRSCHTPGDHSATIKAKWSGRALFELFQYIGENMPKNDPGILEAGENARILAYLLETAGLPAGGEALPADSAGLSSIRFDTVSTKSAPTGGEVKP